MDFLQDSYLWFLFSFLVFAVIAWKRGKNVVLQILDDKIEDIRKSIETAEGLRVESQELLAQYQRKHKDAVKDAEAIVAKAEKQAEDILKTASLDLDDTLKRREKQLQDRLHRIEQAAIEDIRRHAADLALAATAQIVSDTLDKKTRDALVDDSIKSIGKHIH